MSTSNLLTYHLATAADCDSLSILVNNSYRSELAEQGWTNENGLIEGPRTSPDDLFNIINKNDSIIFLFFDNIEQILVGCVYLRHKPEIKTAYLGLLTVRPDFQNRGYGKFIMSVAEKYVINQWNVDYIELSAIKQRTELLSYYNRRGYIDTGRHQPFHTSASSHAIRNDLELCIMHKCVRTNENKIKTLTN